MPGHRPAPPPNAAQFFCADCEVDHIGRRPVRAFCGSPGGASRFQCPGRARPHRRHTPPAALFFGRPDWPKDLNAPSNPRKLVICVSQRLPAEYLFQPVLEESRHERRAPAHARRHRAHKSRALFAPRFHDRLRCRHRRLHARSRPGARRSHHDRTDGLTAGDAKIKVADGEMPGYFARPANASNPPVVLVAMEIFGLHEYIKDVTRRLAKLGAFAVAPDYYFRKSVDLTKITDIPQLLPVVNAKPDAELVTISTARSHGRNRKVATPTGSASSAFAGAGARCGNMPPTAAPEGGRAFYGPVVDPANPLWPKSPTQLAPEMKAPVLGLYGSADTGIPVAQVEAMKAALAGEQENRRIQDLSRCAARLPCRLSRKLSQGSGRRRLGPDASLVQEISSAGLTGLSLGSGLEPFRSAAINRHPWRRRRHAAVRKLIAFDDEPSTS